MTEALKNEIGKQFIGKEKVVEDVLICLLAGGHVLLEDVPGVGKTTLAKTLAKVLQCDFGRIQFTPDTLPGDVIGTTIYDMQTGQFRYRAGAVMHQILLADEINRTSPKTQSSLLEAMEEGQVTVDGETYSLPEPFFVMATQNPVEFMGTYPLPEAQTDRFLMRISIGYPDQKEELRMLRSKLEGEKTTEPMGVCRAEDVRSMREQVKKIHVSDNLLIYARELVELTREDNNFVMGASPRALIHLIKAAQARAFLEEREFVKPDDIKAVAVNVLHHRLNLTSEAKIRKEDVDKLLTALIKKVKVPLE